MPGTGVDVAWALLAAILLVAIGAALYFRSKKNRPWWHQIQ